MVSRVSASSRQFRKDMGSNAYYQYTQPHMDLVRPLRPPWISLLRYGYFFLCRLLTFILFLQGAVRAVVHAEPLTNVNKIIDELRSFEVTGRKVVVPALDKPAA